MFDRRYPNPRGSCRNRVEWLPIIAMMLASSAIAVFPIASVSGEELVGAVGFIAAAPSSIEATEALECGKAKPSDYWADQSSQERQGRLFSAVNFRF